MKPLIATLLALTLSATSAYAQKACELAPVATIPVELTGARMLVDVSVNGNATKALVDTGSAHSLIFRSQAAALGVRPPIATGERFTGVGGGASADFATIRHIKLGSFEAKNLQMWILESRVGEAENFSMLFGADLFSQNDLEFDLQANTLRMFRPIGACSKTALAYWGDNWSYTELLPRARRGDPFMVNVLVNGVEIRALIDSGAPTSILTTDGARIAGMPFHSEALEELGDAGGIGKRTVEQKIGTFETFQIGDEIIKNAKLRVADLFNGGAVAPDRAQMLIGADFLRAHRTYFAFSQNRLYFTHLGGRTFQTTGPMPTAPIETPNPAPAAENAP